MFDLPLVIKVAIQHYDPFGGQRFQTRALHFALLAHALLVLFPHSDGRCRLSLGLRDASLSLGFFVPEKRYAVGQKLRVDLGTLANLSSMR
jgi:hypothetical protein